MSARGNPSVPCGDDVCGGGQPRTMGGRPMQQQRAPAARTMGGRPMQSQAGPAARTMGGRPMQSQAGPAARTMGGRPMQSQAAPVARTMGGRPMQSQVAPVQRSMGGRPLQSQAAPAQRSMGGRPLQMPPPRASSTMRSVPPSAPTGRVAVRASTGVGPSSSTIAMARTTVGVVSTTTSGVAQRPSTGAMARPPAGAVARTAAPVARTAAAARPAPVAATRPAGVAAARAAAVAAARASAVDAARAAAARRSAAIAAGVQPRPSTGAIARPAGVALTRSTAAVQARPSAGAIPRMATGAAARIPTGVQPRPSTGAIPRTATGAVARVPTGVQPRPSAGAIPRTATRAVARVPTGVQPRPSTGAIPRTVTAAVARAGGVQHKTSVGSIRTATGAVTRRTGVEPSTSTTAMVRTTTAVAAKTSTGRIPPAVPPRAPRQLPPQPQPTRPAYQKRVTAPASSGYGPKPRTAPSTERIRPRPSTSGLAARSTTSITSQKTGLAKISTKSVKVAPIPTGVQKITTDIAHVAPAPPGLREGSYNLPVTVPGERSTLETEPILDPTSPYAGRVSPVKSPLPPRSPLGEPSPRSQLSMDVERQLIQAAKRSPDKTVIATGAKVTLVSPPKAMVNDVPVEPTRQVISEKTVETSPGIEKISRTLVGIERLSPCTARRTELQLQQLEQSPPPHPAAPPREAITVKSVVNITADGQRSGDTIVTVEKTKPSEQYGLTPEEVNRMVIEENQDVKKSLKWKPIDLVSSTPTAFATKKKEHEYKLTEGTVSELQKSIVLPDPTPDEAPNDELQPELMATIMHTEEKGMDMMSEPTTIYTYLFPDATELGADVIEVNSAAPAPLHDVAVPSQTLPETFYNTSVNPELERVILETEGHSKKPSAAGFSDYQEKRKDSDTTSTEQTNAVVAKIKKKHHKKRAPTIRPAALDQEQPPWDDEQEKAAKQEQEKQIEKTLLDLVGASPTRGTGSEIPLDSFSVGLSNAEAVDYVLHVEPPIYRSKVQLRGTCVPPWFPGYYVAFPDIPELITVVKYPTIALTAAWKNTQPKIFPDDCFVVI